MTYSSPAFGGDQSPWAATRVVEKGLRAAHVLESAEVSDGLWGLLRELEVLDVANERGKGFEGMDRDCAWALVNRLR